MSDTSRHIAPYYVGGPIGPPYVRGKGREITLQEYNSLEEKGDVANAIREAQEKSENRNPLGIEIRFQFSPSI